MMPRLNVIASNGGHGPKGWARIASSKIVGVAETAPPEIAQQAMAFKHRITGVLAGYFTDHRKEVLEMAAQQLAALGRDDAASLVREMI